MPMPPPKPSTEGPRDRQVANEMGQIVRALQTCGAVAVEELRTMVGAPYWEPGRFARAVSMCVADGLVLRDSQGRLTAL